MLFVTSQRVDLLSSLLFKFFFKQLVLKAGLSRWLLTVDDKSEAQVPEGQTLVN